MLLRLVAVASLAGAVWAQSRDTALLFGSVSDAQGAAVPVANVTLMSVDTHQSRTALSDESGRYTFSLLPVGAYQLMIEKPGFQRYVRSGILLQANENAK